MALPLAAPLVSPPGWVDAASGVALGRKSCRCHNWTLEVEWRSSKRNLPDFSDGAKRELTRAFPIIIRAHAFVRLGGKKGFPKLKYEII